MNYLSGGACDGTSNLTVSTGMFNYPYPDISIQSKAVAVTSFDEPKYSKKKAFTPKEVIFNAPATIIIWKDGSKTVVKCGKDDVYDKEKGVALCFMKKLFNNEGNFNDVFRKFVTYED